MNLASKLSAVQLKTSTLLKTGLFGFEAWGQPSGEREL
jgi:hypothetical protein